MNLRSVLLKLSEIDWAKKDYEVIFVGEGSYNGQKIENVEVNDDEKQVEIW